MKAVVQEKYGSPDDLELREVDKPAFGDDELLVRVRAASVHPDDWHAITGLPYVLRLMPGNGFSGPGNPIPGTDVSGIVESAGKGVTRFRKGDEVFGRTIGPDQWANGGAFAEHVSVRQDRLALKPDNVSFEQAASVPSSGFITLQNLRDPSQLQTGRSVLVNGGGGGVGSLAIQLAKAHGAQVTAVDSTPKLSMLRSLGADQVIDYTQEDFTRGGVRYDLIVDVPLNRRFSACRRALKPDGRYVLIGHDQFGASGRRVFGLLPYFVWMMFLSLFVKQLRGPICPWPGTKETMSVLREFLEAGKITPIIDSTYPLSQAREALRHMIEDEPRGKVIITV